MSAYADPPRPSRAAPITAPITIVPARIAEHGKLRRPRPSDGPLAEHAATLDGVLADASRDLGLTVRDPPRDAPDEASKDDLVAGLDRATRERGAATHVERVIVPSLAARGDAIELVIELAGASPSSQRAQIPPADLAVKAVVMLRALLGHGAAREPIIAVPALPPDGTTLAGRVSLFVNATLFGGLVGFSIQRASGSDDPRVLYPIIGVGAGIGLGAAYLASREWSVNAADAWYFAAGAWWPSLAGHMIYQGRFAPRSPNDRWVFGLLGGVAGAGIATLGLTLGSMSEGGVALAHSGGGFGLAFGALLEIVARGDAKAVPFSGMGYGAGLGWLAAAALATRVQLSAARVLSADVGAIVFGLAGAGAASPLLVTAHGDPMKQRAWAAITLGASVTGAIVGGFVGKRFEGSRRRTGADGAPLFGIIGESAVGEVRAPVFGAGWQGTL